MVITEWKHYNTQAHCLGYWTLYIDGFDYSEAIPIEQRTEPMNTCGDHCCWSQGHYKHYVDGMDCLEWWKNNPWINNLPASPYDIYKAFQLNDWRHGDCDNCKRKEEYNVR